MSSQESLTRVKTIDTRHGDVELGVTDALARHFSRHPVQRRKITQRRLDFERRRPRWLRECIAEAGGVFMYVYPGLASTAALLLSAADSEKASTLAAWSSFLQIGLAYGFGIAFAIIVFASTSGGHFNPAVTISLTVWQGFPLRKVPHFLLSQILGAFVAAALVMAQYHVQLTAFTEASIAADRGTVYNGGPASIFVTLPNPDQTNLGYLFMIEFFVASFISLVIWACLDPANPFMSPTAAPWAIGLAYAVMIWGFGGISIATNMARDLGARLLALCLYGGGVFSYHSYSWIAILVNVPATLFGTAMYELVVRDSLQKICKGAAEFENGGDAFEEHVSKQGYLQSISSS